MNRSKKSNTKWTVAAIVVAILAVASLAIGAFSSLTYLEGFRIIFGSIYVLFLPGFLLTFVFFPKKLDWLERIALGFALSIAVVPLAVFYLNLLGLEISALNSALIVLAIIIISIILIFLRRRR